MTSANNSKSFSTLLFEVGGVALAYWLLYYTNKWIFTSFAFTSTVAWIFLPAAIRVISVLLFGWRGVAGLFIGTLATGIPLFGIARVDTYGYPALSAFAPMLAISLGAYAMKIKADLRGLTARQLLVFAVLGALFSSVSHNLYFQFAGETQSWLTALMPMFVGDLVGTLIVLYAAAAILRSLSSPNTSQQ